MTLGAVRQHILDAGLAIQQVPERLEVVDALSMTATRKIQKNLLRQDIAAKRGG
jgi:cyclohexanecarboxylate-CoA ligase